MHPVSGTKYPACHLIDILRFKACHHRFLHAAGYLTVFLKHPPGQQHSRINAVYCNQAVYLIRLTQSRFRNAAFIQLLFHKILLIVFFRDHLPSGDLCRRNIDGSLLILRQNTFFQLNHDCEYGNGCRQCRHSSPCSDPVPRYSSLLLLFHFLFRPLSFPDRQVCRLILSSTILPFYYSSFFTISASFPLWASTSRPNRPFVR